MTDANVAGRVFISYASQDATVARTLCAAIEAASVPCWIAPRDVRPGEAYAAAIVNAINDCRMLVLVLSKHAIDSPHVLREVERASSKRRPVLSIRLDGTALPPELEYFLSANQWLDASGGPIENVLPALVDSVREQRSIAAAPSPGPVRVRRGRGVLAIALVLVMAGLAYLVTDKLWFSKRVASPPVAVEVASVIPEKSVAVLPFVNMSEDKSNEYFSDGLSEELMALLAQVPDLKVPARTSSFYFKGKQTTIAEIARTLGVAHVLEGSVRKSGNTVRITAQLIRAKDGYDIWSETYDRKLDDIFKIQDETSGAVVKALKVTLLQDGMPKARPAANQEAYALFLQPRSLQYRGTGADVQKAVDYAQRSADLDPAFAPAWAALADSLVYQNVVFGAPHDQARARAFSAAQTALRLDPKLSDGHLAMGRVLGELDWNWTAADVELRTALALDPNNVLALSVSSGYSLIRGRVDDALGLARKAVALDAVSTDAIEGLGDVYLTSGRIADAVAAYRKATELNVTHASVHGALGLALLANGDPAAALREMQLEPDEVSRQYGLAMAFDALGRHSDADHALAVLETGFATTSAGNIGSIYACRKQLDKAFAWFDRGYRQHDGWLPSIKIDPCARNLRSDARFQTLLGNLNFPI